MAVARVAFARSKALAPLVVGNQFKAVMASSLDFLARDNPFSSDLARRELGWDPPVQPETGSRRRFAGGRRTTERGKWRAGRHTEW